MKKDKEEFWSRKKLGLQSFKKKKNDLQNTQHSEECQSDVHCELDMLKKLQTQLKNQRNLMCKNVPVKIVTILCNDECKHDAVSQMKELAFPNLKNLFKWQVQYTEPEIPPIPAGSTKYTNSSYRPVDVFFYHASSAVRLQGEGVLWKLISKLGGLFNEGECCIPVEHEQYCHCNDFVVAFVLINSHGQPIPQGLQSVVESSSDVLLNFVHKTWKSFLSCGTPSKGPYPLSGFSAEDMIRELSPVAKRRFERENDPYAIFAPPDDCPPVTELELAQRNRAFIDFTKELLQIKLDGIDKTMVKMPLSSKLKAKKKAYDQLMVWYQDHEHLALVLSQSSISQQRQDILDQIDLMKRFLDDRLQKLYAAQIAKHHLEQEDKKPPRFMFGGLIDEVKLIDVEEGIFKRAEADVKSSLNFVDHHKHLATKTINQNFQERFVGAVHETLASRKKQQEEMKQQFDELIKEMANLDSLRKLKDQLENEEKKQRPQALEPKIKKEKDAKDELQKSEGNLETARDQHQRIKEKVEETAKEIAETVHTLVDSKGLDLKEGSKENIDTQVNDIIKQFTLDIDNSAITVKEQEEEVASNQSFFEEARHTREKSEELFDEIHLECLNNVQKGRTSPVTKNVTKLMDSKKAELAQGTEHLTTKNYKHIL
mmetsp:Transcript_27617/g.35683  ORF Transcript_27617/g.35683 Transcript_27617/m.35683 type:complete len:654 (+) Transcript_27617:356-2317(+)